MIRKFITVKGIVQGVGFRPYVYKLALVNNLYGWVKNTTKGVLIDIQGDKNSVENFILELKKNPPQLSKIKSIEIIDKKVKSYLSFNIYSSSKETNGITIMSPDIGICNDCIKDIKDNGNRRYRFPFTNCTNCGPRYSIIKELPYDRNKTTMANFIMCSECLKEYTNPLDRRFHSQPNSCPKCGPKYELLDNSYNNISTKDAIKYTIELIKKNKIIGIKGIGGFHLVCNATNVKIIEKLRRRKIRPAKPFAVMMKNIETIKKYCIVSSKEEEILSSEKKPIVILKAKDNNLPNNIAPDNKYLGVMLPYAPIHYLLFDDELEVLIMTSANSSNVPIIYKNEEINKLENIVDYFLIHNRDINVPQDDSVVQVINDSIRVLRNGRGYSPIHINMYDVNDTVACGSYLKNTIAISRDDNVFISQYNGDIKDIEAYNRFNNSIEYFKKIYNIKPKIIAKDMHPLNWSNDYTINDAEVKFVQHHHAHIVSCMVENQTKEKVIGVAFDGIGYGLDKNIWGGEFLLCDYSSCNRVGHLNYKKMPGGDMATKEPWRMAVSYLNNIFNENDIKNFLEFNNLDVNLIIKMISNNINSPDCSSMGRFFDAVSAIIGLISNITYEGEGAILLENFATDVKDDLVYKYSIYEDSNVFIINTDKIIVDIVEDMKNHVDKKIIAKRFHNTVTDFTLHMCNLISKKYSIKKVALSGGVFQNRILLTEVYNKLITSGYIVYTHKLIPCNDSGISLGQLVIANSKNKRDGSFFHEMNKRDTSFSQ